MHRTSGGQFSLAQAALSRSLPMVLALGLLGCGRSEGSAQGQAGVNSGGTFPGGVQGAAATAESQQVDIAKLGFNVGADDAPVRIIEFGDFACHFCRKFHMESFPTIYEKYVKTGEVAFKYIPFVLGIFENGEAGAHGGECAGEQDQFLPMWNRLYEEQEEWKPADDPFEFFIRYAEEEGLDTERYARCLNEGLRADRVRENNRVAHQMLGIRGTPTFYMKGFPPIQGAIPLEVWLEAIETALEAAGAR